MYAVICFCIIVCAHICCQGEGEREGRGRGGGEGGRGKGGGEEGEGRRGEGEGGLSLVFVIHGRLHMVVGDSIGSAVSTRTMRSFLVFCMVSGGSFVSTRSVWGLTDIHTIHRRLCMVHGRLIHFLHCVDVGYCGST